jgi:probable FeS assembly SUF system protein SufT
MPRVYEPVRFVRDCNATLVPSGAEVIVPEGAEGTLTQALGASFTVYVGGSLLRIKGVDADAIGREPPPPLPIPEHPGAEDIEKLVRDQLREVYDPEIPINIVDLGLVYSLAVTPLAEDPQRFRVEISMTLTAPGCGMGGVLVDDIRSRLAAIPPVADVQVDLVFDPPWDMSKMSEEARLESGLL